MGEKSKIEWLDGGDTWNPIRARNKETGGVGHFCVKVSPGCQECYAERQQPRYRNPVRYAAQDAGLVEVFLDATVLARPLHQKKPRRIFPCSMTDLFGDFVPDEWIDMVFAVAALTPQHTYMVLTKRAERMRTYLASRAKSVEFWETAARTLGYTLKFKGLDGHEFGLCPFPLPNWQQGVSVEDDKRARERIPELLAAEVAFRWLSLEPLLDFVDVSPWLAKDMRLTETRERSIDWAVVGGESGPKSRPTIIDAIENVVGQFRAAQVPLFVKQIGHNPVTIQTRGEEQVLVQYPIKDRKGGDPLEWPESILVREYP